MSLAHLLDKAIYNYLSFKLACCQGLPVHVVTWVTTPNESRRGDVMASAGKGSSSISSSSGSIACKSEACAIQDCLAAQDYQEGRCLDAIRALVMCCDKHHLEGKADQCSFGPRYRKLAGIGGAASGTAP